MVVVEYKRLIGVRDVVARIFRAVRHGGDGGARLRERKSAVRRKFVRKQLGRRGKRAVPCA